MRANRALAAAARQTPADPLVGRAYGELAGGDGSASTVALDRGPQAPVGRRRRSSTGSPVPRTTAGSWRRWRPSGTASGRPLYVFLQVQDVTGAARGRGGACARARSASGCWSRRSRTTRSSCSTRPATSPPGTPAPNAARATPPTRSSASTSGSSTRRSGRPRGTPSTSSRSPLRDGHYEEEGWRVRKDGSRFWANVAHHRGARRRPASTSASPRSPATPPSGGDGWSAEQRRRGARRGQRRARAREPAAQQAADDQSAVPGGDRARAPHARSGC